MSIQPASNGGTPQSPQDKVIPGATVVVKDLDLGDEEEFTLVSIRDVDYEAGKILVDSPLAQGLLHKKAGDKVAIKVPKGTINLEILSVQFLQK